MLTGVRQRQVPKKPPLCFPGIELFDRTRLRSKDPFILKQVAYL